MTRAIRVIALFYVAAAGLQLHAQRTDAAAAAASATGGMRLEELERIALTGNPALAQMQANVRMAAGQVLQAGLYPNPSIGYYGDEIRGGYSGGGKQGAFISQTIVTGGKLGAARRVAQLSAQEAETSADMQRLRILNSVRMLFYRVLAAQRLVEVRENLAKLSADAARTAAQLANVGQADRPDVLQAEVEQQQMILAVRTAQQNLKAMWRSMAAVIGQPNLPQGRLEGDLESVPDLDYEESLRITLRDSPEIHLAQQRIERALASFAQAKQAAMPDLQVYGNLSQNNQPLMESSPRATGLNGGVQIGVQIPVFNRNQGNVAAAKAEMESATQEVSRLRLEVARSVAELFHGYESARETAHQYKTEILPRAEEAYRLYLANYQHMAAAYSQTLFSQRVLFQLQSDYVQALDAAWQSVVAVRGFGLVDEFSQPSPLPVATGRR